MKVTTAPIDKSPVQRVEEGKRRLETLNTRLTRAKAILETTAAQLETAQAEAGMEYGVMTAGELATLLGERQTQNAAKADAFTAALDQAEAQVKALESHLAQ
jgi:hypothetical protein